MFVVAFLLVDVPQIEDGTTEFIWEKLRKNVNVNRLKKTTSRLRKSSKPLQFTFEGFPCMDFFNDLT